MEDNSKRDFLKIFTLPENTVDAQPIYYWKYSNVHKTFK